MSETIFFKERLTHSLKTDSLFFDLEFVDRKEWIRMDYQHFHPFYEMFFFIEGDCNYILDGASYKIKPYDFVLVNKYMLHKATYSSKYSKRLLISFTKDFLSEKFDSQLLWILSSFENQVPIFRFDQPEREVIFNLINEFYTYVYKNDPARDIMLRDTLLRLVYTIKKFSDNNIYTNNPSDKNSIDKKMQDVTIYIHNNYDQKVTLENLAKKFYISSHYLSRKFKEHTGFSVTDYIQLTRVKKACELLIETNFKVIKISELCGFGSLSQFNRCFLKNTGSSPSTYRKETKENLSRSY